MGLVVVVHPVCDGGDRGGRIWERIDADVVPLERFDECLGDAVAFGTFNRGETGLEVERGGDVEGFPCCIDGAVVGEPLDRMGCPWRMEAGLDAFDHEVSDHLPRDACGGSDPADDLAIVAVERERDAHDLVVPASELEPVRTPPYVGSQGDDLSIMFAGPTATGVPREQHFIAD